MSKTSKTLTTNTEYHSDEEVVTVYHTPGYPCVIVDCTNEDGDRGAVSLVPADARKVARWLLKSADAVERDMPGKDSA